MLEDRSLLADKYIICLRIIQPARVQDIVASIQKIWGEKISDDERGVLYDLHSRMRENGNLVDVRRGTYVLTSAGMEIAAKLVKERDLDNARMFLMKGERKSYHSLAGRLG